MMLILRSMLRNSALRHGTTCLRALAIMRPYRHRDMSQVGQSHQFGSAREASGVPPIALEIYALHCGTNGPQPTTGHGGPFRNAGNQCI
jgi:hypothetical protein